MNQLKKYFLVLLCMLFWLGCGQKEGDSGGSDFSGFTGGDSGDCIGGGWCGEESITVTANLEGAKALFTLQDSSSSVLGSVSKALIGTQSKFYKLKSNGEYEEIISALTTSSIDAKRDLPLISFVAVSELGDVFLAYEHPFMYKTPSSDYADPWSPSSPYTCQLFKVESSIPDFEEDPLTASKRICCVTNSLELDTWDYRSNKIQFDSSGNGYFTAHVPQNWKNVLIKWNKTSSPTIDSDGTCTYPSSALTEVINSNIIFRDYLVVPTGGIFYTGITSTDGGYDHGDSFLRFKTSSSELQEITSGWWDYVFQPVGVDDSLNGIDTSISLSTSELSERVIFYGPDPLVATSPEWDDSCLFLYNPNESGSSRSTQIADCDIDIWNYVNWAETVSTRRTRCNETKYMMGGGNQPKKILLADSYDSSGNYKTSDEFSADGNEEIYVVGNIYSKKAGEWRFDLSIDEAHCTINSLPSYTYNTGSSSTDETNCTNNSGTWVSNGEWYSQLTDTTLLDAIGDGNDDRWQVNGEWCESPGGDWRETYSGLARVDYTNDTTKSVILLSSTNEIVKNGWSVNDHVYYVSFDVDNGDYQLKEVGNSTALLTGYEIYELFKDPNNVNKLYFNGLKFSDNSYVMGTFDPTDVTNTFSEETGITGQIETLIVIPDSLLQ